MGICDQITFEQLLQPMEALLLNVIYNKVKNAEMAKEIYHNTIVPGCQILISYEINRNFLLGCSA